LPAGSILVDVGGGIGHTSLTIAQRNPALRIVNQDLEHQVADAKAVSGSKRIKFRFPGTYPTHRIAALGENIPVPSEEPNGRVPRSARSTLILFIVTFTSLQRSTSSTLNP
jgi:hypothetical protein